jgi:hypothetical protein
MPLSQRYSKWYGKYHALELSDFEKKRGDHGVLDFITRNKLTSPPASSITIRSTPKTTKASTISDYARTWEDLYKFAVLRGDFCSACILNRDLCPESPYPVLPSTICEYIEWKVSGRNVILRDYFTQQPIFDVNNEVMYGCDSWHAPGNVNKFRASMLALHGAYIDLRGEYSPVCKDCIALNDDFQNDPTTPTGLYGSCTRHPGTPLLRPKGNPMNSSEVIGQVRRIKDDVLSEWKVKGNVQLLPGEIRNLRDYLIGSGSLNNFQIYVMIIVGIKLFLRADELLGIQVEDFVKEYHVIPDGTIVKALALTVKGKIFPCNGFLSVLHDIFIMSCVLLPVAMYLVSEY